MKKTLNKPIFFLLLAIIFNGCASQTDFTEQLSTPKEKLKEDAEVVSKKKQPKETSKTKQEIWTLQRYEYKGYLNKKKSPINNKNNIKQPPKKIIGKVAIKRVDILGIKKRLVGMDKEGVIGFFGAPTFKRSEPPAKIWQYRTVVCVVNIFLYKNGKKLKVEFVEPRWRKSGNADEEGCFRSILKLNPAYNKPS